MTDGRADAPALLEEWVKEISRLTDVETQYSIGEGFKRTIFIGTSYVLELLTDCMLSPSTTVGLLETSYDVTYEATSTSRDRTLDKNSFEGAPLPLSLFSPQRSLKKHLDVSLVSSRTSSTRAMQDPGSVPCVLT